MKSIYYRFVSVRVNTIRMRERAVSVEKYLLRNTVYTYATIESKGIKYLE